ncbi:MAG TPA: hypothetical protein VEC01_11395 [Noviherbaspirillum sp.]|uniref:hypothetical protein n=1 Tax=Noviherbaspirillum sp. TaxID=1926288 RepID=UPI002D503178|nr:hypothetical protein [Noviherbaspirillum sp.]HYD95922.1 hypothetical protein [Noviherbaspirillum sp.]
MSFAWTQLQAAIRVLAGTTDRRDRLAAAYGRLIKLKPKDLPAEAAGSFACLTGRIARFPAKNVAHEIRSEVQSLTDQEVAHAIQQIMAMYDAVAAYQPRPAVCAAGRQRRAAPAVDWPVPALHLLEPQRFASEREPRR